MTERRHLIINRVGFAKIMMDDLEIAYSSSTSVLENTRYYWVTHHVVLKVVLTKFHVSIQSLF